MYGGIWIPLLNRVSTDYVTAIFREKTVIFIKKKWNGNNVEKSIDDLK